MRSRGDDFKPINVGFTLTARGHGRVNPSIGAAATTTRPMAAMPNITIEPPHDRDATLIADVARAAQPEPRGAA